MSTARPAALLSTTTNDDYLTENWQPRELEHSLVSFTEWAVEGGIDHDTRRQQKKPEAV